MSFDPSKNKHNALSPDKLQLATAYTFTISPCDTVYRNKEQLKDKIMILRQLLYDNFNLFGVKYRLFPELSKTGRLHAHGTIKFNDYVGIALLYNTLYNVRDIVTYELDTINDPALWSEYIIKNKSNMKAYCKHVKCAYRMEN